MNPIFYRYKFFFRTARIILNDDLLLRLIREKKYSYIVGISQNKLDVEQYVKVKVKKTSNIFLDKSPEELLFSFHDTCRNEIRRTFKIDGLEIVRGHKNFNELYALYKKFRKNKQLSIKPKNFIKSSLVFSAYYKNKLIVAVTYYDVYPYLRIQNIFSYLDVKDKEIRKITGYATRRLIYEICIYGITHKYNFLDLASVNFSDGLKIGITKFKMSFGGKIVDEYTYTCRGRFIRFMAYVRSFLNLSILKM